MSIRTKTEIEVDFHSHVLPFMDDGAKDVETSRKMLSLHAEQGVKRVAATSHFDFRKESAADFLSRRSKSLDRLFSECDADALPEIIPGAEVYLMPGLSDIPLEPLCYKDTNYVLVEMPYLMPYSNEICEELEIIAYKQKLVPVIAHIDRYFEWYSDSDIEELLSFDDAIFQINTHAFLKKHTCRKVAEIIKNGYPVVIGSDAHDLEGRRPDFDMLYSVTGKHYFRKHILPGILETLDRMDF